MAISPKVLKLAVTVATDKRTLQIFAILLTSILMPIILLILMLFTTFSQTGTANKQLLDCCFAGAEIPNECSDEQRGAIEDMRKRLGELDDIISEKENTEEISLDRDMVRAVFYCLNFGAELDEKFDYNAFCNCFESLTANELNTALQNVSEEFPQYEITDNLIYSTKQIYSYLKDLLTKVNP